MFCATHAMLRMKGPSWLFLLAAIACHTSHGAEEVYEIAKDVYAFFPGGDYHSMFIVTTEGVIAIEPVSTDHSTKMLAAIKKITNETVKYMIYSHNHLDHSSGGQVFKDAGAEILAHKECDVWIKYNKGADQIRPTKTWDGSNYTITMGGFTLQLHYFGMNHGRGMTVFLLPDQKVAYIADLVVPNRVFFTIVPDYNIKQWMRTLEILLKLDFDRAIYAHNMKPNAIEGGNKTDVQLTLDYINDIRNGIFAALKRGENAFLIPKTLKLPKYEKWHFYKQWLTMNIWRIFLDEWMGPYPWRPSNERPGTTN
ncbi:2,4-dinitroanisole O-demethylase subunit alpha-like [Hydractinia symbiolongicarpus]|uniref:2,4-dinitroanisole O-demethylase subunit alpha-like n=1 Tax=Hydractinia symbiolongicarpus TaxID=13093 RepID=UPI00254B9787|nr:2,4-dinitroanisole O-demethylase subunit alpha-like [Hydractinia symbiolongicarpus]